MGKFYSSRYKRNQRKRNKRRNKDRVESEKAGWIVFIITVVLLLLFLYFLVPFIKNEDKKGGLTFCEEIEKELWINNKTCAEKDNLLLGVSRSGKEFVLDDIILVGYKGDDSFRISLDEYYYFSSAGKSPSPSGSKNYLISDMEFAPEEIQISLVTDKDGERVLCRIPKIYKVIKCVNGIENG